MSKPEVHEIKVVVHSPDGETPADQKPLPTKGFDHRLWVIPTILAICAGLLGYYVYADRIQTILPNSLTQLSDVVTKRETPIRGEQKDRINVLLLGIGGAGHDGGTLTDSIMVASIKPSTKQVALLSLPRDLIVKIYDDTDKDYWEGRKINTAYALGGMDVAVEKVEEVTGLNMHFYVLIDFSGFRSLVDDVGGIDVTVPHDFVGLYGSKDLSAPCPRTDTYYLEDGAYCAIDFTAGETSMDGETALIYARIRKLASGSPNRDEGSDFARAKRQQQVLAGFKDKVLSAGTIVNPTRISTLLTDLDDHMITNFQLWEISRMLQLVGIVDPANMITQVVDDSPDGLVMSTISTETGASVVVPTAGDYDYSEIQALAKTIFELAPTESPNTLNGAESTVENTVLDEQSTVTVQVLNGTNTRGLASSVGETLTTAGYTVSNVGNALTRDYSTTIIYPLTDQATEADATALQTLVDGAIASDRQTETLVSLDDGVLDSSADFVIIVGTDVSTDQTDPE